MNKGFSLQRQLRQITNQNQILRSKTKKIHQIEGYVNVLINNNKAHQEEINILNAQNIHLKNQIELLINQKNHQQSQFDSQYKMLKFNYENDFQKMTNEIRSILNEKQKDQILHQRQKQQIICRANNQIQKLKLSIQHLHRQNQITNRNMANTITKQLQDLEISQKQLVKTKKMHISDLTQEQNQKSYILNMKNQLQNENILLSDQVNKQNKLLQQFSKIKEELISQLQLLGLQNEKLEQNYQKQLKNLKFKLSEVQIINKNLQLYVQELSNQLKRARDQLKNKNLELQKLQSKYNKSQENYRQIQNQTKKFKIKCQNQNEDFARAKKRFNQQILRLTQQNQIFHQKLNAQKQSNETKTIQIQDLIKVIDKLQVNLTDFQDKIKKLLKENNYLNQHVAKITIILQQTNYENKLISQNQRKWQQNIFILDQQKSNLEKLVINLKEQNEKYNKQLQCIYFQMEQNKQVVEIKWKEQINLLNQKVLNQKRQIIQNHRQEIQEVIKQYENALKTKDQQFKKRLSLLQQQIMVMRVRN